MGVQSDKFVAETDEFDLENAPEAGAPLAKSGWAAAEESAAGSNDFPEDFKLTETEQLVKFIDTEGPAAVYKLHFFENKKGRKGYACLGQNCPLCAEFTDPKMKPSDKYVFTVAEVKRVKEEVDGKEVWVTKVTRKKLTGGIRLYKTLREADSSSAGPLHKPLWTIKKSGAGATVLYHPSPVKLRDLEEDFSIDPAFVASELEEIKPYDKAELVQEVSREALLEVVKELS